MDEEQLWRDAKAFARKNNRSMDWAYIIDIYTALGGHKTRVFYQEEQGVINRLLGVYTDFQDLVITQDNKIKLVPHEEVMVKRKTIDKDGIGKSNKYYLVADIAEDIIGPVISKGYKGTKIIVSD